MLKSEKRNVRFRKLFSSLHFLRACELCKEFIFLSRRNCIHRNRKEIDSQTYFLTIYLFNYITHVNKSWLDVLTENRCVLVQLSHLLLTSSPLYIQTDLHGHTRLYVRKIKMKNAWLFSKHRTYTT